MSTVNSSYICIMLYLKGADFFYHLHKHWRDVLLLCITSRVQLRATAGFSEGKNYHFKCYVHRPASRAFWNNEDERYTNAEICRHQQRKSSKMQIYFSDISEIIFHNQCVSFFHRTFCISVFISAEEPVHL